MIEVRRRGGALPAGSDVSTILTTRGDLLTRDASTPIRLGLGEKGFYPISNGTDIEYQRILDPTKHKLIFEDWDQGGAAGATVGSYNWLATTGSAGALNASQTTAAGVYNTGWMRHRLTTNAGFANTTTGSSFLIGGGRIYMEACIYIATLNNGVDDARFQFGLGNSATAAQHTNGIYGMYDSANAKFQACTTASSSTTATAVGSNVVATNRYLLGLGINDDGTSVQAYINRVAVGSAQTTNIPTTATFMHFGACWGKTAGAGTLDLHVDYLYFHQIFSGNRYT